MVLRPGWVRPLLQSAVASVWRQVQAIAAKEIPTRIGGYDAARPSTWPDAASIRGPQRAAVTITEEPALRGLGSLVASRWNNSLEHQQQMTTVAALDPTFAAAHFGARSHRYVRLAHGGLLWYLFPWLGPAADKPSIEITGNSWAWCIPALVSRPDTTDATAADSLASSRVTAPYGLRSAHIDAGDGWQLAKSGISLPPQPLPPSEPVARASHPWSLLLTLQPVVLYTVLNPSPCMPDQGATAFWPGSHLRVASALQRAAEAGREGGDWRTSLAPLLRAVRASCAPGSAVQPALQPGEAVLALGWTVHAAVDARRPMPLRHHGAEPEWATALLAGWEGMKVAKRGEEGSADVGCVRFLQNARATARLRVSADDDTGGRASPAGFASGAERPGDCARWSNSTLQVRHADAQAAQIAALLPTDAPIRKALPIPALSDAGGSFD